MVTAAAMEHGDRYTIIGVPTDTPGGDQAVADFISGRNVDSIVHLADTGPVWREFGPRSLPSWATVRIDGRVEVGSGAMPNSVIAGDWTN